MCIEKELTYPLYVSVNMQVVTPMVTHESAKENVNVTVSFDS